MSIPTNRSVSEPLVAMSTLELIYPDQLAPCSHVHLEQVSNDHATNNIPKWLCFPLRNCFNLAMHTPPSWCDQSNPVPENFSTSSCIAINLLVKDVSTVALDSYFVFDPGGQHNIWDPGGLTQLSD